VWVLWCPIKIYIHKQKSKSIDISKKNNNLLALQYGKNTPYMAIFSTILFRLTGISGVGVFRFFGGNPPQKLTKTFSKILQMLKNIRIKIRDNTSQNFYFSLILSKMVWNIYSFKDKFFD